jgi:LuxR family transcriptional activator of bioluminescence operon
MQTDLLIKIRKVVEGFANDQDLLCSVKTFCDDIGVENFYFASSLFNISNTTPDLRTLSAYPEEWQQRYEHANYFDNDLTVKHCRTKNTPLMWLDPATELDKKNKKIFAEASEFGIVSGITFPYHGVGSEFGLLSGTVSKDFEHSSLDSIVTQHSLYLLGAALFDLHNQDKDNAYVDILTAREKECLRWAAEGKTAWEMSVILSISERTACFHLDNAKKKLNSVTRTGAVSKALLHSLL